MEYYLLSWSLQSTYATGLVTSNLIKGTFVNLIYLCIFFIFKFNTNALRILAVTVTVLTTFEIFFGLYYALNFDNHKIDAEDSKAKYIGLGAMIFNIGMYAAPAQNIITVFKTEDETLLPVHISIIAFFCSTTWLTYGLLNFDINVVVPNVLGVIFTVFQIVVYFYYKNKDKVKKDLSEYIGEKKL